VESIVNTEEQRKMLADLLDNIGYEVMPFKTAVDNVVAEVPKEILLTVTVTEDRGLDPTLDTAISLREKGYTVAPHISARLVSSTEELDSIVSRLKAAEINRIFIVAGDPEEPVGEFNDTLDLFRALKSLGHHFDDIGIGGYPEGHDSFPDSDIDQALREKSDYTDRIITQMCFNADTITEWGTRIKNEGVELPVYVGMPGPISSQKLSRISEGLGLGKSANFLKAEEDMPSTYEPTELVKGLIQNLPTSDTTIAGLHINTFNDLVSTEEWRRELLKQTK